MEKMSKQCWSCKNYKIGVNPFSDTEGIEYCELELDGYDDECEKYDDINKEE